MHRSCFGSNSYRFPLRLETLSPTRALLHAIPSSPSHPSSRPSLRLVPSLTLSHNKVHVRTNCAHNGRYRHSFLLSEVSLAEVGIFKAHYGVISFHKIRCLLQGEAFRRVSSGAHLGAVCVGRAHLIVTCTTRLELLQCSGLTSKLLHLCRCRQFAQGNELLLFL